MADLTTNSIPKATGATQVDDSGFSDDSTGNIFAALTDDQSQIDFGQKPNFRISSTNPDFILALVPVEGGTSTPVITIDSVGTGYGGSLEFMTAKGVGGTPLTTDDFNYLGSIYWSGLDQNNSVRDSVTITVRAGSDYAHSHAASYEVKTCNQNQDNLPRFTIDRDGDTNIQNGNLILQSHAPASADAAGKQGSVTWDTDFLYVCVDTDTWKRVALATWP